MSRICTRRVGPVGHALSEIYLQGQSASLAADVQTSNAHVVAAGICHVVSCCVMLSHGSML
jgi:hypothetical protein